MAEDGREGARGGVKPESEREARDRERGHTGRQKDRERQRQTTAPPALQSGVYVLMHVCLHVFLQQLLRTCERSFCVYVTMGVPAYVSTSAGLRRGFPSCAPRCCSSHRCVCSYALFICLHGYACSCAC